MIGAVLRVLSRLEEVTRPPRQQWVDLDTPLPGCRDDAPPDELLAEREAEEEVGEPCRPGCVNLGWSHIHAGTDIRRLCGAMRDHPTLPYACTKLSGHDGDHGYGGVFWPKFGSCPKCCAPYVIGKPCTTCLLGCLAEPTLSNDELVAVRQLIEERFGDQTCSPIDVSPAGDRAGEVRGAPPASPSPARSTTSTPSKRMRPPPA